MRDIGKKELVRLRVRLHDVRNDLYQFKDEDLELIDILIEQYKCSNIEWESTTDIPEKHKYLLVVDRDYDIQNSTWSGYDFRNYLNQEIDGVRYWIYEENVPLPKE